MIKIVFIGNRPIQNSSRPSRTKIISFAFIANFLLLNVPSKFSKNSQLNTTFKVKNNKKPKMKQLFFVISGIEFKGKKEDLVKLLNDGGIIPRGVVCDKSRNRVGFRTFGECSKEQVEDLLQQSRLRRLEVKAVAVSRNFYTKFKNMWQIVSFQRRNIKILKKSFITGNMRSTWRS